MLRSDARVARTQPTQKRRRLTPREIGAPCAWIAQTRRTIVSFPSWNGKYIPSCCRAALTSYLRSCWVHDVKTSPSHTLAHLQRNKPSHTPPPPNTSLQLTTLSRIEERTVLSVDDGACYWLKRRRSRGIGTRPRYISRVLKIDSLSSSSSLEIKMFFELIQSEHEFKGPRIMHILCIGHGFFMHSIAQ